MTLQPGFIGIGVGLIAWALWLRWKLKKLEKLISLPRDQYASWEDVEQLKQWVRNVECKQGSDHRHLFKHLVDLQQWLDRNAKDYARLRKVVNYNFGIIDRRFRAMRKRR